MSGPAWAPRVSVVMPAYNSAPYVEEAVGSLLAQTFADFELVVVDDGSTDDTAERVMRFEDPRVRLTRIEHVGYVRAGNAAFAAARGELVCRADSDDIFLPTLLERQVEVLDLHPRTAAVGVWHRAIGARQTIGRPPTEPGKIRRRLRTSNCMSQPVMIRAAALRAAGGGFRQVMWEDWDLWIRLAARADLRNIPEILCMLRVRGDSVYRSADRYRRELGRREARITAARLLGVGPRSAVALTRSFVRTPLAPLFMRLREEKRPVPPATVRAPSVSVVVPTFRRVDQLRGCLDGVTGQAPPPAEVVVVYRPADDQETAAFLESWCAADRAARRAVEVTEPGLVAALQAGTDVCRGDVVAYIDDDAVPRPGWLAELCRGFLDSTVTGVGGRFVDHIDGREVTGRADRVGIITWWGRVVGNHHLETDYYGDVDLIPGANMAFRRGAIVHDTRLLTMHNGLVLGNELQTCLMVRKAAGRILFSPWAVVDHYTTSYRDPSLGSRVAGEDLVAAAANYTFILLNFLPWQRRIAYRLYAYLVGSANQSGPLRAALELPRDPRRAYTMATRVGPTWRGRIRGERMYRASRRRSREGR